MPKEEAVTALAEVVLAEVEGEKEEGEKEEVGKEEVALVQEGEKKVGHLVVVVAERKQSSPVTRDIMKYSLSLRSSKCKHIALLHSSYKFRPSRERWISRYPRNR